jgi:hypothetical protein
MAAGSDHLASTSIETPDLLLEYLLMNTEPIQPGLSEPIV